MTLEREFRSVLAGYPPSFCLFCERETAYDGWEIASSDSAVTLFCDDCGHRKYTLPWSEVLPDLRAEIRFVMEDME